MSGCAMVVAAEAAHGKRRKRSAAERLKIVEETLASGVSVAAVARAHRINANQIFAWRKLHQAGKLGGRMPEKAQAVSVESSMKLLPVSVSDAPPPLIAVASSVALIAEPNVARNASSEAELSASSSAISSIHIQFAKAKVHVEGAADPQLLRAVLECLRG